MVYYTIQLENENGHVVLHSPANYLIDPLLTLVYDFM